MVDDLSNSNNVNKFTKLRNNLKLNTEAEFFHFKNLRINYLEQTQKIEFKKAIMNYRVQELLQENEECR